MYIVPSATIGVVSRVVPPGGWYTHAGRSRATLATDICVSGENRIDRYDPEYVSHSPEPSGAAAIREKVTWACTGTSSTAASSVTAVRILFIARPSTSSDTQRDQSILLRRSGRRRTA